MRSMHCCKLIDWPGHRATYSRGADPWTERLGTTNQIRHIIFRDRVAPKAIGIAHKPIGSLFSVRLLTLAILKNNKRLH